MTKDNKGLAVIFLSGLTSNVAKYREVLDKAKIISKDRKPVMKTNGKYTNCVIYLDVYDSIENHVLPVIWKAQAAIGLVSDRDFTAILYSFFPKFLYDESAYFKGSESECFMEVRELVHMDAIGEKSGESEETGEAGEKKRAKSDFLLSDWIPVEPGYEKNFPYMKNGREMEFLKLFLDIAKGLHRTIYIRKSDIYMEFQGEGRYDSWGDKMLKVSDMALDEQEWQKIAKSDGSWVVIQSLDGYVYLTNGIYIFSMTDVQGCINLVEYFPFLPKDQLTKLLKTSWITLGHGKIDRLPAEKNNLGWFMHNASDHDRLCMNLVVILDNIGCKPPEYIAEPLNEGRKRFENPAELFPLEKDKLKK